MKAYDVAVDQQLSRTEISKDVMSNMPLEVCNLYVVLIMLCTRSAPDCVGSAVYSRGMENVL